MAVRIKCGWKMVWNYGLGASPEARLENGSKDRSRRLLKTPLGGVHTFLLITNKLSYIYSEKKNQKDIYQKRLTVVSPEHGLSS